MQQDDRDDQRRASFLRRRFGSVRTAKPANADHESVRGPLGLRQLYASPEPLLDIIFVHGLRGGSVKTWQKGNDPRLFWPRHWLPAEDGFRNASIHSFGYEADWKSSTPSILSVHDFGQALYEEMRSSPLLRRNPRSPIIFVGHSMGGLVIKKAYILAYGEREKCDISNRIRAIFFLATPHRGSNYAALLNNILRVSELAGVSSYRGYIDDLTVGSQSSQHLNEEFMSYIDSLPIFSFYEILPTSIGVSSTIIVDRDSAVLGPGHNNERATYLNANHGNMCKFPDPSDSNYLIVKNALASAVQDLVEDITVQTKKLNATNLQSLRTLLGAKDHVEDHRERLDGSCRWIDDREDYKDWRDSITEVDDGTEYKPSIYWITANPGAGKTVLVTYVESQLREFGLEYGAYYFNFGKKEFNSLAGLLRSIAYQMARSNATVRETLLKGNEQDSTLDLDDARAIWSKIFREGIFQIPDLAPQYWLIDALDECFAYPELFSLLKGSSAAFPLKILITSRQLPDMTKHIRQLGSVSLQLVEIPSQDTMKDIELYISSRMADLSLGSDEETTTLAQQITARSNASFLWVRLVLDELEGLYGYESIMEVLDSIPEGMVLFYQRTVTQMAENKRERHITRAILYWIVLATRPLSVGELAHALSVDVKAQLSSSKSAIEGLCGHLVSIDAESDHVHIVHSTAREFLLSDDAGEFRVSSVESHERLAGVCLELLCSSEMQPPRHRRILEHKRPQAKASTVLLEYAISHFSDHVSSASTGSTEMLVALVKFLSSNVLTWMEKVATKGELHRLPGTTRNLKTFLVCASRSDLMQRQHVECVSSWATDLDRVATKFHAALLSYPLSIYFLIPPLCPTESAIYRQFRRIPDGLTLLGASEQNWDDCVATVDFGGKKATTVSCGAGSVAVAFESGDIALYNNRGKETNMVIHSDEAIDLVQFHPDGSSIAGASRRFLMLWNGQGNLLWKIQIRVRFYLLAFSTNCVLGVTRSGHVMKWDTETGELVDTLEFPHQPPEGKDNEVGLKGLPSKVPSVGAVSPNLELLALGYRNGPVCLFDLESTDFVGWAIDAYSRNPLYLFCNPNSDVNLLLVIYDESHMSLFDSWSGLELSNYKPEKHVIPISAACSPSGRTFATIDIQGSLQIWDFESLILLCHIMTPGTYFEVLRFTSDGFNLIDVTNHAMKVWSPSALLSTTARGEVDGEGNDTIGHEPGVVIPKNAYETLQSSRIEAYTAHPTRPIAFVGKKNGDLSLHNPMDGKEASILYTHQESVCFIASCRENIIASSDLFSIVKVWTLTTSQSNTVQLGELKFTARTSPICQLLLDDQGDYLLVSTTEGDSVYRITDGVMVGSITWGWKERTSWRWVVMPDNRQGSVFGFIHNHSLTRYSASTFPSPCETPPLGLNYRIEEGFKETSMIAALYNATAKHLVLHYTQATAHRKYSLVAMFQIPSFPDETLPPLPHPPVQPLIFPTLSDRFKYALGFTVHDDRLVFLSKDMWVCSIPLIGSPSGYTRHFFVPAEYTTTSEDILPTQVSGDAFVFCLFDKIAIIKNGLRFQHHVDETH